MNIRLVAIAACVALVGCGSDAPDTQWHPGGPAVCEGGPEAPRYTVESLSSIGPGSNVLLEREDELLIVESLQNTVSVFTPESRTLRTFADVGENANPYDVAFSGPRLWVSNYLAGSVDEFDHDGERVRTIETDLKNPAGLAVEGDRLWVTDVNYLSPTDGFGDAQIAVFDTDGTRLTTHQLDAKNLQFARSEVIDGDDYIFAVASGSIEFVNGEPQTTSSSHVYRWPSDVELDALDSAAVATLEVTEPTRSAALGQIHRKPGTDLAYIASGVAPVVYVLDLKSMEWIRGIDDPIEVYSTTREALHHGAFDDRGIFYLTAFNQDALYLIDTRCDAVLAGPIDLGQNPELLEGPHGVVAREQSAYFIMSLSNSLGRVRFDW